MGYDPPTTPGAERRAVDDHCAVAAQTEAAFPSLFQALEDQGGVGADVERVLTFHLADLFHQCGRAMLFVELHIYLVDGPGAEEWVGVVPAGAHQSHDAQEEKNSTFHDAKLRFMGYTSCGNLKKIDGIILLKKRITIKQSSVLDDF